MKKNFVILIFLLSVININTGVFASSSLLEIGSGINKIVSTQVICHSFDDSIKSIELNVMNVLKNDVEEIFNELFEINFPIYMASGFIESRSITEGTQISLHSYGAAIDINELINPYFNIQTMKMDLERNSDRDKDLKLITANLSNWNIVGDELTSVLKIVIQEEGSDDRFLNREIKRKGMITDKVVSIFRNHGFNIWGGKWRQPMDFMHFQIPRVLAEKLLEVDEATAQDLWKKHKRSIQKKNIFQTMWSKAFDFVKKCRKYCCIATE